MSSFLMNGNSYILLVESNPMNELLLSKEKCEFLLSKVFTPYDGMLLNSWNIKQMCWIFIFDNQIINFANFNMSIKWNLFS